MNLYIHSPCREFIKKQRSMTKILTISSSPNPTASDTKTLVDTFIGSWVSSDAALQITHRDIGSNPPAHLDDDTVAAFYASPEELTRHQLELTRYSDEIIAEVQAADLIVIGAPMHNFGIPSTLKAWIDHLTRVGKTFTFSKNGPVGLLVDKQIVVLGARGGNYSKTSQIRIWIIKRLI